MQPTEIPTINNTPEIEQIEALGDGKVKISWCVAEGAGRYSIRRSFGNNKDFERIAGVSGDQTEYIDQTANSEGVYWYQIIAVREYGADKPIKKKSKTACVSIFSLKAPTLETLVEKKDGIHLSWSNCKDADGYNIIKRYDFMKAGVPVATVKKGETKFVEKNCIKGPLFYYSVKSFKLDGEHTKTSNNSNEIAWVRFDKVKVLSVSRKHGKKVTVDVRLCSGADGYILFKSLEEKGEYKEVSRTNSISELTLHDKGKKGERAAFYKVACYKKLQDKEIVGPLNSAVAVKYKF